MRLPLLAYQNGAAGCTRNTGSALCRVSPQPDFWYASSGSRITASDPAA